MKRMTEAYTQQTLHDYALDHIQAVAESMGYRIAEINPARENWSGPDIYVVNPVSGKARARILGFQMILTFKIPRQRPNACRLLSAALKTILPCARE